MTWNFIFLFLLCDSVPVLARHEMIQISLCNHDRARTWYWFKNNQIFQRTLIQEKRLA
ncbi:hypothetical protein [Leptodesmis sp.]|uniref:hypothetical protein n=1 Tax=Leptodesmis sp. TaxID=3100501 RepID=UPI0040534DE8